MEVDVEINPEIEPIELLGPADSHLRLVRELLDVKISARQQNLHIEGQERTAREAAEVLVQMQNILLRERPLTAADVKALISAGKSARLGEESDTIPVYAPKRVVRASTPGQSKYIQTMMKNDVTFCTGPAGTGKTYLAVAVAVSMLRRKQIRKIVLARPAVEAGEKLGFLPGDLQAKVNPYLRPLFDALEDMMEFSQMKKFTELDIIEIIPLAFMRGRTLNEAAIICDEAQNTSALQMMMVLTRLGHGSKMIITGDITQVDLVSSQRSGMVEAIDTLKRVKGIGVVALNQKDIVRHKLVQNIVRAYKRRQEKKE